MLKLSLKEGESIPEFEEGDELGFHTRLPYRGGGLMHHTGISVL